MQEKQAGPHYFSLHKESNEDEGSFIVLSGLKVMHVTFYRRFDRPLGYARDVLSTF